MHSPRRLAGAPELAGSRAARSLNGAMMTSSSTKVKAERSVLQFHDDHGDSLPARRLDPLRTNSTSGGIDQLSRDARPCRAASAAPPATCPSLGDERPRYRRAPAAPTMPRRRAWPVRADRPHYRIRPPEVHVAVAMRRSLGVRTEKIDFQRLERLQPTAARFLPADPEEYPSCHNYSTLPGVANAEALATLIPTALPAGGESR